MRQQLNTIALIFLLVGFAVLTFLLFIPNVSLLPFFGAYLTLVLGVQYLKHGPLPFVLGGVVTLIGVFCMTRVPSDMVLVIPSLLLSLWGGMFLIFVHQDHGWRRQQKIRSDKETILLKNKNLKKEIAYYLERKKVLSQHSAQRRQLSQVARELGSLLDTQKIQDRLIEKTRNIFQGRDVVVSYGQTPDSIENFVIQRKKSVMVPSHLFKGDPLLVAPITSQNAVVAIIRVGGIPGAVFTPDDLRLLEILAGLASLALDNSFLFRQIEDSALRDGLTGLFTVRAFNEHVEEGILEASRYNQPLSMILTDVDHFKSINDTYGHQAGDQVLQGCAHVLARNVRDVDIVARYGGEEFVVLLYNTTHEEAVSIAESVRADLEAQRFEVGESQVINVTGSFGVSTFPEDATSAQQLIRIADQRMYAAKKGGRNQVHGKAA